MCCGSAQVRPLVPNIAFVMVLSVRRLPLGRRARNLAAAARMHYQPRRFNVGLGWCLRISASSARGLFDYLDENQRDT
jgi:hypothetical protein